MGFLCFSYRSEGWLAPNGVFFSCVRCGGGSGAEPACVRPSVRPSVRPCVRASGQKAFFNLQDFVKNAFRSCFLSILGRFGSIFTDIFGSLRLTFWVDFIENFRSLRLTFWGKKGAPGAATRRTPKSKICKNRLVLQRFGLSPLGLC